MEDIIFSSYIDALKQNYSSSSIHLKSESLSKEQIERLSEALKHNFSLKNLTLENMNIGDEGAIILAEAIKENTHIYDLKLKAANIGDIGFAALTMALQNNNRISNLSLENNKITDMGIPRLAELLGKNKKLRWLDLNNNKFTNSGAALLVDSLKQNDCLKSLILNRAVLERFNEAILVNSEDVLLTQFGEPMIALQADYSLLKNIVTMGYLRLLNKLLDIPQIVFDAYLEENLMLKTAIEKKQPKIIERLLQVESVYNRFKKHAAKILLDTMTHSDVACYEVLLEALPHNKRSKQLAQTLKSAIKDDKIIFCDYVLKYPNLSSVIQAFKFLVQKTLTGKTGKKRYYGYIYALFSKPNGHRFLRANNYQLCTMFNLELLNASIPSWISDQGTYAEELQKTVSGRAILAHSGFIVENGVAKTATPEQKTLQQRLVLLEQKRAEAQQLLTQVTQLRALHFAIRAQPHKQELERQIPLYSAKRLHVTNAVTMTDLPAVTYGSGRVSSSTDRSSPNEGDSSIKRLRTIPG